MTSTESTRATITSSSSEDEAGYPAQGLLSSLLRHLPGTGKLGIPRKLAALPFSVALLTPPTAEQSERCRLQLQRVQHIALRRTCRDQRGTMLLPILLTLRPEKQLVQVGIFVPHNPPTLKEKTRSLEEVRQLLKLLEFCVHLKRHGHGDDCAFCSQLRECVGEKWSRLPLVTMARDGSTRLRTLVLCRFLTDLVSLVATEGGSDTDGPMQSVPTSPDEVSKPGSSACATHNKVAAVLCDFFGVLPQRQQQS